MEPSRDSAIYDTKGKAMKQRGATPEEDRARGLIDEGVISEVTPYSGGGGWSISFGDHYGCGVRDVGVEPKVGDVLTLFGTIGYPFHGQALNGELLWYLTPDEEEAKRQADIAEADRKKREQFEEERPKLDAAYETLPETFKERIDKFRRTNPDFRWQFESYEMGCCTDAVKVASYCSVNRIAEPEDGSEPTAADNIVAFQRLPWEEQKKSGVSGGHSGNSFGFVVRLAYLWVTDPGLVVQEHGALTPLVGCEEYGCPHEREPVDA